MTVRFSVLTRVTKDKNIASSDCAISVVSGWALGGCCSTRQLHSGQENASFYLHNNYVELSYIEIIIRTYSVSQKHYVALLASVNSANLDVRTCRFNCLSSDVVNRTRRWSVADIIMCRQRLWTFSAHNCSWFSNIYSVSQKK